MKMTNDAFLCCDECFANAAKRSTKAAKLWIDLCAYYVYSEGVFGFRADDMPELRMLEMMGYIITVDYDRGVMVQVWGLSMDEQGIYFCPGNCDE